MAYSHERPAVGATRARQGRIGRHIFWVLVFGIALTVLGFAATWAWKAGDFAATQPKNAAQPSDAAAFQAPQPSDAARQNEHKTVTPQNRDANTPPY